MTEEKKVFIIAESFEEERPRIDFAYEKERNDFSTANDVLYHGKQEWPDLRFTVRQPDALDWDCYDGSGLSVLFSEKAKKLLGPYANEYFDFLPVYINGHCYYCGKVKKTLDCLDRDKSMLEYFPSHPDDPDADKDIMIIDKYAFRKELMNDTLIFTIPERKTAFFTTESIKSIAEKAGLRGMFFADPDLVGG